MVSTLMIAFVGLVATYVFLRFVLYLTQDRKEPPAILTEIPFFGPLFGIIGEKSRFYVRLRSVSRVEPSSSFFVQVLTLKQGHIQAPNIYSSVAVLAHLCR